MELVAAGKWADGYTLANIVRTVLTLQQYKQPAGVPYRYLQVAHKNETGVPKRSQGRRECV